MTNDLTKEIALKYLGDVSPDKCFWVNNGPVLKSMGELADAMPQMSGETYSHHANKEKNDFSRWIAEVIEDQKLANDLLSARNKESAVKKLKSRLASLRKKAD